MTIDAGCTIIIEKAMSQVLAILNSSSHSTDGNEITRRHTLLSFINGLINSSGTRSSGLGNIFVCILSIAITISIPCLTLYFDFYMYIYIALQQLKSYIPKIEELFSLNLVANNQASLKSDSINGMNNILLCDNSNNTILYYYRY